jgi:L-fuculose-phosphate aldolase
MMSSATPFDPDAFLHERTAVADLMRRLYALRLTTASGGNISLRLAGDRCAVTPGGGDKSVTAPNQLAILSLDGENLTPDRKPSSEHPMHLAIYRRCPRVGAIVHAHPQTSSAFTAVESPILTDLTAEGFAILRRVVVVPYAITGSRGLAELVADAARSADCLLLANHGVTTLGRTLLEAFNRLEVLEAAAWQTFVTQQMKGRRRLTPEQLAELEQLYGPFAGDE